MRYLNRFGILLSAFGLCVGMASCGDDDYYEDAEENMTENYYWDADYLCGHVFTVSSQWESWSDENDGTSSEKDVSRGHTTLIVYDNEKQQNIGDVSVQFVTEYTIDIVGNDSTPYVRYLAIVPMKVMGYDRRCVLECNSKFEIYPQYYSSEYHTDGEVKGAYFEYVEYIEELSGRNVTFGNIYNGTLFNKPGGEGYEAKKLYHSSTVMRCYVHEYKSYYTFMREFNCLID